MIADMPKFIPKIVKNECKERVSFIYEGFRENLVEMIERKKLNKEHFLFCEIFAFFTTMINGLAVLQLHEYTIDFYPKDLFMTTNNVIKCTAIKKMASTNLDRATYEFGLLMIYMNTLKSIDSLLENYDNFISQDDLIIQEINKALGQMEEIFKGEIFVQEEKKQLEIFLKIMRSIFFKRSKKQKDFLHFFTKILPCRAQNILEQMILYVDTKGFDLIN